MKHGTTRDTRTKCGGRSFICITDREDEALPLGRMNEARFKAMIKKELKDNKSYEISIEIGSTRNHVGIKSLREDGNNLKISVTFQNLNAMLREFLVLVLLFTYYFSFL
ncbi:hypothetical protein Tco_1562960 [Tanacetum coccineum]